MNISSLSYKLILKMSLLGLTGLGSYTAMACAYIQSNPGEDVGLAPIFGTYPEPILFCKQSFADSSLTYAPDPDSIVAGGSQVISMGNTVQQYPLSNTVNLSGFTPTNLNINSGALSINYPNTDGYAGSPSLFNFYTTVSYYRDCHTTPRGGDQFKLMMRYLRNNGSSIFAISNYNSIETVPENSAGLDIITFQGVRFQNQSNPSVNITGDLTLYHANKNNSNSTIGTGFWGKKYCWLGVGARVNIHNNDLKNAGDYDLNVAVNVR